MIDIFTMHAHQDRSKIRVVVAMSGGVDSSVAAALLIEQGYDVVGMMMRLWSEEREGASNRCCTPEGVEDARRVADLLGIPFYLVNMESRFRDTVVQFFLDEYSAGRTPNPCLACNKHIRFDALLKRALSLDAQYLATGHYAWVTHDEAGYHLLRGTDPQKDQSYVLHQLGQEQLQHVMFPIGRMTKPEVRAYAEQRGLLVAHKAESMELCFIADNNYRRFLQEHAKNPIASGLMVNTQGEVLGTHEGLPSYTIGQRKGLGVALGKPAYVVGMNAEKNQVIIGEEQDLWNNALLARNLTWISGVMPTEPVQVEAKVRYKAALAPATVYPQPGGTARVVFDTPQRALTPGQGVVFYRGEETLGGGIIQKALDVQSDNVPQTEEAMPA